MRTWTVLCAIMVTGGHSGQVLGAGEVLLWETPCKQVYDFDDLMEQGRLPIVAGANNADKLQLFNLDSGRAEWETPLSGGVQSLAVSGQTLVLLNNSAIGGLSVADGKVLWFQPLKGMLDRAWVLGQERNPVKWFGMPSPRTQNIGGGLLVVDDNVLLKVGDRIYCLNATTGKIVWSAAGPFKLSVPLFAMNGLVLVAADKPGLYALDLKTGRQLWWVEQAPMGLGDRAQAVGDRLYCKCRDKVLRIDPNTGKPAWMSITRLPNDIFFAEAGGKLIARADRQVEVFHLDNGGQLWTSQTEGQASAIRGDRLYYSLPQSKRLSSLDMTTLQERWTSPDLQEPVVALLPFDDVVVVYSGTRIAGVNAKSGTLAWSWQGDGARGGFFNGALVFEYHGLAFGKAFHYVRAVRPQTGREVMYPWMQGGGGFFFCNWLGAYRNKLIARCGLPDNLRALQIPAEAITTPG